MTTESSTARTLLRGWPPGQNRPLAGPNSDLPVAMTVQITLRGEDALSAAARLVAEVGAIPDAEVTVSTARTAEERTQLPEGGQATTPRDERDAEPPGAERSPPLRILAGEHVAVLEGRRLTLPRREYDLLVFLSTHPRRVFTRQQLLRTVWGYEFDCGGRTIDVHVRRLRQKLDGRGPTIATVRGVGYRLDHPERVQVVGSAEH